MPKNKLPITVGYQKSSSSNLGGSPGEYLSLITFIYFILLVVESAFVPYFTFEISSTAKIRLNLKILGGVVCCVSMFSFLLAFVRQLAHVSFFA